MKSKRYSQLWSVDEFISLLLEKRAFIINCIGVSRPTQLPTDRSYVLWLRTFVTISSVKAATKKIVRPLCASGTLSKYQTNECINRCIKSAYFLHYLRLLSYLLSILKVNETYVSEVRTPFRAIVCLLKRSIECEYERIKYSKCNVVNKREQLACKRLTNVITNPMFKGAMKQYHYMCKKTVDFHASSLARDSDTYVASKWTESDHSHSVVRYSHRNLVYMASVHTLILYYITFLPLYVIEDIFNNFTRNVDKRTNDLDVLHLQRMIIDHMRSRINVKYVEVNIAQCTCLAKCMGLIGKMGSVKDEIEKDILCTSNMEIVCAFCRSAPAVESTKSTKKARREIPVRNTAYDRCAGCGTAMYKFARLYICDIRKGQHDRTEIRFSARFFTTSSRRFTNEIDGKKDKTPAAKFHGMCVGGDRRCNQLVQVEEASMPKIKPPNLLSNTRLWTRCLRCCNRDHVTSMLSSLRIVNTEAIEKNSCLARFINDKNDKITIEEFCTGCLIASTCFHLDRYISDQLCMPNMTEGFYKNVLRILNKLLHVRLYVINYFKK